MGLYIGTVGAILSLLADLRRSRTPPNRKIGLVTELRFHIID